MKFKILNKNITKELEEISKIISWNSPVPALQGILITATESSMELLASNGNLSIKKIIEKKHGLEIMEPGVSLLPGKLFVEIIKNQKENIEISIEKNKALIKAEGSESTINLMDHKEYPTIGFETIGKILVIDTEAINSLIKNVSFATAENDKRIILNGVNLRSEKSHLIATATNSFRLAQETVETDSDVDFDITILSKNLKDFIPSNADGPIEINVNDSQIITTHKNTTIVSKLIDGVYPDIQKAIPSSFNHILSINSKELIATLDKAIIISEEGTNKVVRMTINKEKLVIESKKKEIGNTTTSTTDFEWRSKEEKDNYVIALNAQYLKDAVSKFSGTVVVGFNSNQQPLVIKGKSNSHLLQLVLPHRAY